MVLKVSGLKYNLPITKHGIYNEQNESRLNKNKKKEMKNNLHK